VCNLTWENGPMMQSGWWRLHCTSCERTTVHNTHWQSQAVMSGECANFVVATDAKLVSFSLSCQVFVKCPLAIKWLFDIMELVFLRRLTVKIEQCNYFIFYRIHHVATKTSRADICYTSDLHPRCGSGLEGQTNSNLSDYGYSIEKEAANR